MFNRFFQFLESAGQADTDGRAARGRFDDDRVKIILKNGLIMLKEARLCLRKLV